MDKGASFCHVKRIRPVCGRIPCVTSGNQEWKGARPSLMASEINMVSVVRLLVCG